MALLNQTMLGISVPDGRTFAYKVNDGTPRLQMAISIAGLRFLGVNADKELEKTYGGESIVGSIRATF